MKSIGLVLLFAVFGCGWLIGKAGELGSAIEQCSAKDGAALAVDVTTILASSGELTLSDSDLAQIEALAATYGFDAVKCVIDKLVQHWSAAQHAQVSFERTAELARARDYLRRHGAAK